MALPGLNPMWVLDWPMALIAAVQARLKAQEREAERAMRRKGR